MEAGAEPLLFSPAGGGVGGAMMHNIRENCYPEYAEKDIPGAMLGQFQHSGICSDFPLPASKPLFYSLYVRAHAGCSLSDIDSRSAVSVENLHLSPLHMTLGYLGM